MAWHGQESLGGRGQGGGPSPSPVICLKLGEVVVQVPLHGPQVLRGVARSRDHLEPDEAQGVEDHSAGAAQPDPVRRVDCGCGWRHRADVTAVMTAVWTSLVATTTAAVVTGRFDTVWEFALEVSYFLRCETKDATSLPRWDPCHSNVRRNNSFS